MHYESPFLPYRDLKIITSNLLLIKSIYTDKNNNVIIPKEIRENIWGASNNEDDSISTEWSRIKSPWFDVVSVVVLDSDAFIWFSGVIDVLWAEKLAEEPEPTEKKTDELRNDVDGALEELITREVLSMDESSVWFIVTFLKKVTKGVGKVDGFCDGFNVGNKDGCCVTGGDLPSQLALLSALLKHTQEGTSSE